MKGSEYTNTGSIRQAHLGANDGGAATLPSGINMAMLDAGRTAAGSECGALSVCETLSLSYCKLVALCNTPA